MDTTYDAIVVGSGIGGMTAAGLLAGVDKKKVLVLEKHTEPGGLTHVFRRDGASWDVGIHYIGELGPKSRTRKFFDYLSGGELRWNRLPENFERFVYPGIDLRVPANKAEYIRVLIQQFPQEARAIRRYFADVKRAAMWDRLHFVRSMVPRPVEPMIRWIRQRTNKLGTMTTGEYLAKRFRSPELRAVIASQWGDYGLPPSLSAFAIHAQIVYHYFNGAWFPDGGSARIARTFEKGIERRGGCIYVAQDVQEILLENGKPVGVRVIDQRGPKPVERIYKAPVVISNVGVFNTFEKLLPTGGEIGAKTAALRGLARRLSGGLSVVTLYLRLKADPRTIGIQGENNWLSNTFDHDDIAGQTRGLLAGKPNGVYVSFPSIKAKDERFHTAEMISPVDAGAFQQWRNTPKGNRGAEYTELKQRISDGLIKFADARIPGLAKLIEYAELSTPLTQEHYTSYPHGVYNGLMATPERHRTTLLGCRTPIEGLYLAGADAGCVGIMGALAAGIGAACQVMGAKGFPMIVSAVSKGPTLASLASGAYPLPEHKKRAKLVAKRALTPSIWHMEFQVDGKVDGYAPGQFARLHVGDGQWRDYSIVGLDGKKVEFLISTRTGGDGSHFVQSAAVGTATEIELPLGQYTLAKSGRRKVFVATGTGLAPFVPMFRTLQADGTLNDSILFFGCRTADENITPESKPLPGKVVCCVSREKAPAGGHSGRVTTALSDFKFDPEATDFYLCGSSAMVADCAELLQKRGAKYLFTESY